MKNIGAPVVQLTRQSGITLIEVLVSLGLGIFFLGIAVQYLVVGQQSNQVQDAGSRIQENARFANNLLRGSVQLAGYTTSTEGDQPPFIYTGACFGFDPCSDDELGDDVGDSIAVALVADGNVNQDCLGNNVTVDTEFANVFWIQEVNNVRSLYCRGWDIESNTALSGAQPLVDGVEQMQVQYGLSNVGAGDFGGPVVGFLSASSVEAMNGWAFVRAVRVSILVDSGLRTDESDQAGAASLQEDMRTYALLDGPDYQINDDRVRRVYTSTIELNNSFD